MKNLTSTFTVRKSTIAVFNHAETNQNNQSKSAQVTGWLKWL